MTLVRNNPPHDRKPPDPKPMNNIYVNPLTLSHPIFHLLQRCRSFLPHQVITKIFLVASSVLSVMLFPNVSAIRTFTEFHYRHSAGSLGRRNCS